MAEPAVHPAPSFARRVWPAAVLLVGLAVLLACGVPGRLSLDTLAAHRDVLCGFVAAHTAEAAMVYVGAYTAAVAFSVPGALLLTITGGFLFGTGWATVLAVVGATAGAIAVFLAARAAAGTLERPGANRRAGPWVARLERGFRDDAFCYMLFLRLVPVFPFWLVNLVPALLGVRLRVYAAATLIGIAPGALVYASVGSGLGAVLDAGGDPDLGLLTSAELALPLAGLGLLALLPAAVRRLRPQLGNRR